MNFPNHSIQIDSTQKPIVVAIQQQLNARGCGPVDVDGVFGDDTENAVELFQSRFTDQQGNPLTIDGIVGPVTWATLFGPATVSTVTDAPNALSSAALSVAISQIGVMEVPPGSNNGPIVNSYQDLVNIPNGSAWCMAFIYFCFNRAATNLGIPNPVFKTGGVLDEWNNSTGEKILAADAVVNTSLVLPGQIFVISTGGGDGHTGFIEKIEGGLLTTIEGNTNSNGSSEGIGVFRRTARTINSINRGFLQFG